MSTVYLLDPSSSLTTHILTKGKASIGSTTFPLSDSSYVLNVQGITCTNNVSAFQIPADTSNNRPAGQRGYIRYNTTNNIIEFWSGASNSWASISEPTPTITSINPTYVPQDSSLSYIITGNNFNQLASVSFIGAVDGITYPPYGGTIYLSASSLQVRNTITMSDASINGTGANPGFYVKVLNSNSGFSTTSATPILSFDYGPVWNTAENTNLGSGITGQLYTTSTTPFTPLSATDIHTPVTYYYTVAPSTVTGNVLLDASSGKLYNQMPTVLNNSTNYTFSAVASDSSGALNTPRVFIFTVNPTSYFLTPPSGSASNAFFTPNLYSPASTPFSVAYVPGATTTGFNFSLYFNTDVSLNILLKGANGGGSVAGYGGGGGWAFGRLGFAKNTTYTLLIGGGGAAQAAGAGTGSYVNGGGGLAGTQGYGAQGGGYTGLFTTSSTFGNALLVASGGGGGAYENFYYTTNIANNTTTINYTNGGSGGDTNGYDGLSSTVLYNGQALNSVIGTSGIGGSTGGSGGTQSAGGSGGTGPSTGGSGGALTGGNCGGSGDGGGGGGGGSGYYGGGSGTGSNPGSSGAGGSSYVSTAVVLNGFSIGGITTTGLNTAGANGSANFYYSLNSAVSVTYVSGTALPIPTVVNGSWCYVFNAGGGATAPGTTATYTFTINQPVVMGYLCVAGGGSGGTNGGGGGGGGGLLQGTTFVTANTNITIIVGAGGAGVAGGGNFGNNGVNSSISGGVTSTITSIGGGGGGPNNASGVGLAGGSGGGGGSADGSSILSQSGGLGTLGQGYIGGFGCHISGSLLGGGGGGGAGGYGSNLGPNPWNNSGGPAISSGGNGGKGIYSYITGSQVGYAGGGGGAMNTNTGYGYYSGWGGCAGYAVATTNNFGAGQGGGGGGASGSTYKANTAGTNGTGGGSGGAEHPNSVASLGGGSGVVVIRIPQVW